MHELLTFLVEERPKIAHFQNWHSQQIEGSANNLLYRTINKTNDLAIKFTIRDARRRAWREHQALLALQEAAPGLAPRPIWLDENSYPFPVVIQSWESGIVTADPPQSDQEWEQLITHYATSARVTPQKTAAFLATAVMNFTSIPHAHQLIQKQLDSIPALERPHSLQNLLARLNAFPQRPCPQPDTLTLCRNDSNTLNFIRRPDHWLSVDWENSGWGDPAFEIVDMICHPQYASVAPERWSWVIALYGTLSGDETAVHRIQAYTPLMLVWWVARLARAGYEVPRGLDQRLAERPSDWAIRNQALYEQYVDLATTALAAKKV